MSTTQDLDEILQTQDPAPLILLLGPSRSGKTSIQRVVFGKLSPHETQFLEQTTQPCGIHYPANDPSTVKEALLRCRIIDLPGNFFRQYSPQLLIKLLSAAACIVYVIDASNDSSWPEATQGLMELLIRMEQNQLTTCPISVLMHKTDLDNNNSTGGMSGQYADLRRNLLDALRTNSVHLPLTFHVTSLFDITIFECFSRIFQQIIPRTNLIGTLLDGFISACGIEKAYLIDTNSKLYIATDSTTPDVALYQLLSDMVDLTFDIGLVYSPHQGDEDDANTELGQDGVNDNNNTTQQPQQQQDTNDVLMNNKKKTEDKKKAAAAADFFDCYTAETVLQNGVSLSLRQLNNHLSILYSLRPDKRVVSRRGTIEYNITCFKQAISQIFNISLYGVQNRVVKGNGVNPLLASGGAGGAAAAAAGEFGINGYMGSYASTSALANLKSMYQFGTSVAPGGSLYQSGNNTGGGGGGSSYMNPAQSMRGGNTGMMGNVNNNPSGRQSNNNNNNNMNMNNQQQAGHSLNY